MPDILQDFPIRAPVARVFEAVSSPPGLDRWWTLRSSGQPALGAEYQLWFGPEYDWRARVTRCEPGRSFELELTGAMDDWMGSRVGFDLEEREGVTQVRFRHTGWPAASEHYRVSCHCWAMYLRILRRYLEYGETVAYEKRLEV